MAGSAPGESLRVFPLSDWTERDVWAYVAAEGIDGRLALFRRANGRRCERDGTLLIVDDDRFRFGPARWRRRAGCGSARSAAIR